MDDATQNMVTERLCTQCGAPADFGRISCTKCGAALPPDSLAQSTTQDVKRRAIVTVVKVMAGIAAVVFLLCPLSTGMQVLAFGGSIVVLLICHFVLASLDENSIDQRMKNGYWPPKPIDWSPLPDGHDANEKRTAKPKP